MALLSHTWHSLFTSWILSHPTTLIFSSKCFPGPELFSLKGHQFLQVQEMQEKMLQQLTQISLDYTRQQNFTFFLSHEGKYQILIELLTLNSNM
jgi:hypothetical protein